MEPTDKEIKESSSSPSDQQIDEQRGRTSCPTCGACGTGKCPMEAMMAKGPMAMIQKMPAMCMAFMVVTPTLLGLAVGIMIGRTTTRAR